MAVVVQILWWGCSTTAWQWALKPSAGSSSTWSRPPLGCRCSSRSVSTAAPTWSQTCTHAEAPKNRFLQESLGQPAKIEQGWSKFLCTANPSYHNYYPYLSSAVDSRIPKTKQALCQLLCFLATCYTNNQRLLRKIVLTVSVLSWHSSTPGSTGHPAGPQSSNGTFLHSVSGVYFLTVCFCREHLLRGQFEHFSSVV